MSRRRDNSVNRNSVEASSSQMNSSSLSVKSEDSEQGSFNVASEDSEMSSMDTLNYEPTREMNFRPGARLEAKDLGNDIWYPVKVIEVDWEGEEILIHFEKWSARYDEWISMDSPRLRPAQKTEIQSEKKTFSVGEEVMGTWSDSRKYPARIKTVLDGDKYEVVFFDGFQKVIKGCRMSKLTKAQLETITDLAPSMKKEVVVEEKKPIIPIPVTPVVKPKINIFEETSVVGSKEERRERKRKINVAELLQPRKRSRNTDSVSSPKTELKKEEEEEKVKLEESEPAAEETKDDENAEENLSEEHESSAAELTSEEKDRLKKNWWMKKRRRRSQQLPVRNTSFKVKMSFCSKKAPVSEDKPSTESRRSFPRGKRRRSHFLNNSSVFNKEGTKKQENMKPGSSKTSVKSAVGVADKKYEQLGETPHGERPSIELYDPNLPNGWSKWGSQRKHGCSAGKWDVYLVGPDGRKFRTHSEIRNFCIENKTPFSKTFFNFSMGKRKYKRSTSSVDEPQKRTPQDKQSSVTSPSPSGSTEHRRIKTLLPKVRSSHSVEKQFTEQSLPAATYTSDSTKPAGSDGEVIVGGLKIQMDNSMFVCPKEGCLKHFRKENLLQMHLKHYHPEYNKYVSSTPNVADLAYARTVGESFDDIPKSRYPVTPEKNVRFETPKRVRTASPIAATESFFSDRRKSLTKEKVTSIPAKKTGKNVNASETWPVPEEPSVPSVTTTTEPTISTNTNIQEKQQPPVEETKPEPPPAPAPVTTTIKTLLPVAVSPSKSLDISLEDRLRSLENKDLTSPEISAPHVQEDVVNNKGQRGGNVRKRNSSSTSFADLSPVKKRRSTVLESASVSKSESTVPRGDIRSAPRAAAVAASYRCSKRRASLYPQVSVERLDIKVDGNEAHKKKPEVDVVQKKVDLKKQELINCICGIVEEDGLMIQCDVCMCWQHGICNNIEKESDVPEKYICYICQNPFRGRASKKYCHDQEWLKDGKHPSLSFRSKNLAAIAQRESILRRSHDMTSTLLQLQQVLHSLKVKLSIAQKPDHPKLYLWAKHWEKTSKLENGSQLESDKKHMAITGFTDTGSIEGKHYEIDSLKSSLLNSGDHFNTLDVLKGNILNHPINLDGNVNLSNLDLLKGSILEHSNEEEMVEDGLQIHHKAVSESGDNVNNVNLDILNNKPMLYDDKVSSVEGNETLTAVNNDAHTTENVNENTIQMTSSSDGNMSEPSIQGKNNIPEPINNKCDNTENFQSESAVSEDLSSAKEFSDSQENKNNDTMLVEKDISAKSPLHSNIANDNAKMDNDDLKERASPISNLEVTKDNEINNTNGNETLLSNSDVPKDNIDTDANITNDTVSLPSDVSKNNATADLSIINETTSHPSISSIAEGNDITNIIDTNSSLSNTIQHSDKTHEVGNMEETLTTTENTNVTNILDEPSDTISEKQDVQDTRLDSTNSQADISTSDVNKHDSIPPVEEAQVAPTSVDIKEEHIELDTSIDKIINNVSNEFLSDKRSELDITNMKEILANEDVKQETGLSDVKNLDLIKQEYDGGHLNEDDFGNKLFAGKCDPTDTLLQQALISEGDINIGHGFDHSLQLPICQNELIQFATTMAQKLSAAEQEQQRQQQQATRIPQPEAPIDPKECQISLLEHLKHYQNMIEMRLSALETQVSALEAEDPDMINDEPANFYPRTKQTVIMLQRDLRTMQQIAGVKY